MLCECGNYPDSAITRYLNENKLTESHFMIYGIIYTKPSNYYKLNIEEQASENIAVC